MLVVVKSNLETIYNVVLGTAGHIDHGKSSLIQRLTGVDPDRLPEEKARGLTIDLGFAPLTLENGRRIGVIDVPGHERLIKNMVAGATGIDAVLLVVAADDGVMPQTREHLTIMELLNLKHGLVAITKVDLVDAEFRELVRSDIADTLAGTFLENAPMVEVSSTTGEGIEALRNELDRLLPVVPPRDTTGIFRMPIQRVFSSKGFGTVVTGVPVGGQVSVGDTLEVVPLGKKGRVRGLHAYGETTDLVRAGHSSAVNITDIDYREVHRGMVLTCPGYFRSATLFEARFRYLPMHRQPLQHQAPVRLHVGTAEGIGRIYILDKKVLEPGDEAFVQFRLEQPLVAAPGDRFVLRSYSPLHTLGGGGIIDQSRWRLKTGKKQVLELLREKAEAVKDPRKLVAAVLHAQGYEGAVDKDLARRTGLPQDEVNTVLDELEKAGEISRAERGGLLLSRARLDEARNALLQSAANFFRENPRRRYLEQGQLRQQLGAHDAFFQHLVQTLQSEGVVTEAHGGKLGFRDYGPRLDEEEQAICAQILEDLAAQLFSPPAPAELAEKYNWPLATAEELTRLLVEEQKAIQLTEGVFLHQEAVAEARRRIGKHLEAGGSLTASEAKQLLGSTRKFGIPLLEHLDRIGFTVRRGDVRVLRATE